MLFGRDQPDEDLGGLVSRTEHGDRVAGSGRTGRPGERCQGNIHERRVRQRSTS